MDLSRAPTGARGPDIATLEDPANDVAYKMIGGAYGVLGAEVLGHFVPRVLDEKRWGIYVRDAGVAWLCRELAPSVPANRLGELPQRLARAVAAHHYVHCAVEAAVIGAHGEAYYRDLLVKQSPRHGEQEERLAEMSFRAQALSGLALQTRRLWEDPVTALMARTPEGTSSTSSTAIAEIVERLNREFSLGMTAADVDFGKPGTLVPCFLVMEPHLPEPLASAIQQGLLG